MFFLHKSPILKHILFFYWFVKLSKFHILLSQLVVIIVPQTFRFSHSFDSIGVYCIYFSHAIFSCLLYLKFSVIHAFIPPPPPPSFWLNSVTRCNNVENATPDSHFNSSCPSFSPTILIKLAKKRIHLELCLKTRFTEQIPIYAHMTNGINGH